MKYTFVGDESTSDCEFCGNNKPKDNFLMFYSSNSEILMCRNCQKELAKLIIDEGE